MPEDRDACAISIEIDKRQQYLFETDKLQEMLGASRLMDETVSVAEAVFTEAAGLYCFQPVSGEIRAWAAREKRDALLAAAWSLRDWLSERGIEHSVSYVEVSRAHFEQYASAPVATNRGARPDLARVHKALSKESSRIKAQKPGLDARPFCALFAPCRLHGHDAANYWFTAAQADPREERRNQVGFRALWKWRAWNQTKREFYRDFLQEPVWERVREWCRDVKPRAVTFRDLAEQLEGSVGGDQYISFICADADGMSRVLPKLDWNDPGWAANGMTPWRANRDFSKELNECFLTAFKDAVVAVTVPDRSAAERLNTQENPVIDLPLLPQLLGGDDFWVVARRDVALPLCEAFGKKFVEALEGKPTVKSALKLAFGDQPPPLTISFGIAFAKYGHPAFALAAAAEELLSEAKAFKKGWHHRSDGLIPEGCLDWYWIESSLTESVTEARSAGYRYRDHDGSLIELTSLPWTLAQSGQMRAAAREFRRLARRKREQLDGILRRGEQLSTLGWDAWWVSLEAREREVLRDLNQKHLQVAGFELPTGPCGQMRPWIEKGGKFTPLLDLLRLIDVLEVDGGEDTAGTLAASSAPEEGGDA